MPVFKDVSGQRFCRLKAIAPHGKNKTGTTLWFCVCDCGKETVVSVDSLLRGKTKSCGCIKKIPPSRRTHGQRNTKLYGVWAAIKRRCKNPNCAEYKNYGGRGISYPPEWESFEPFAEWATANGYRQGLTIERIDNDRGYSPENCKFVDTKTQARNRRSNRLETFLGETKTVAEWMEDPRILVPAKTLKARLDHGWDFTRAATLVSPSDTPLA